MDDIKKEENIIYKPMEWFLVSRTDPETVTTLSSDGFGNEVITSNGIPINQTEKYEQLKEMIKESSANVTELSSSTNYPQCSIFTIGDHYLVEFSPKSLRGEQDTTLAIIVDKDELSKLRISENDVFDIIDKADVQKTPTDKKLMIPFSEKAREVNMPDFLFLFSLFPIANDLKKDPHLYCPISFHCNEQRLPFDSHIELARMFSELELNFYLGDTPEGPMFSRFVEQFPSLDTTIPDKEKIMEDLKKKYGDIKPNDPKYNDYIAELSAALEDASKATQFVISDTYQPKQSELSFDVSKGLSCAENYTKLNDFVDKILNYKGPHNFNTDDFLMSKMVIRNPMKSSKNGKSQDIEHPNSSVLGEIVPIDPYTISTDDAKSTEPTQEDHPGATVSNEVVISDMEPKRRATRSAVSPAKDSIVPPTKESDGKASASVDEPQETYTEPVVDTSSEIDEENQDEIADTQESHDVTFKQFLKDLFNTPTKDSKVKSSIDNNDFLKKVTIKKVLKVLKSMRSFLDKTIQRLEDALEDEEEERFDD